MGAWRRASSCWLAVPGQQFVDAIDRMVGDACEDVAQICLRIASVQFCGFDERVHGGGPDAAGIGAGEQVVLARQSERPDRPLDCIVGHFQAPVCRVARQRGPARQGITDRFRERALATDLAQCLLQKGLQFGEKRNGVLLAGGEALRRRAAVEIGTEVLCASRANAHRFLLLA